MGEILKDGQSNSNQSATSLRVHDSSSDSRTSKVMNGMSKLFAAPHPHPNRVAKT